MTEQSRFPQSFRPDIEVSTIDLDEEEFTYRGERLTEAGAERVVTEALRKLRSDNLVPGGKSLSGDGSHSPTIQYRVPADLRKAAEERAATEGVSVSRLARRAL